MEQPTSKRSRIASHKEAVEHDSTLINKSVSLWRSVPPTAQSRMYSDIHIGGDARVHLGDAHSASNASKLARLPVAKGAAFDSREEHNARCLVDTRVDLQYWAEDKDGKCIFWLSGMAGTGKSTISHTVAQSLSEKGCLRASFFFKRGEGDCSSASRFFTTISYQLAHTVPSLSQSVEKAIEKILLCLRNL